MSEENNSMIYDNIDQIREEYSKQDNRMTKYPILVHVQELQCIGRMADDYYPSGLFGDAVLKKECPGIDCCEYVQIEDDDGECIYDEDDDLHGCDDDCKHAIPMGYVWIPVEFFLTVKGARHYMKANAHNHSKLRTYITMFERRNQEMRTLLRDIDFEMED